jgi:hypothetical protein
MRELAHSIVVEHAPEHEVIYGSDPTGEKLGEGDTAAKQQPPQAPYLAHQMSKWFYNTFTSTATRAVRCGS